MLRSSMAVAVVALALVGCDDTPMQDVDAGPTPDGVIDPAMADQASPPDASDSADVGVHDPIDADPPDATPLPPRPPWCARVHPAAPDDRAEPLQWSRAHGLARFFSPLGPPGAVDDALVAALGADEPLAAYAAALPAVCAVDQASPAPLGPAVVEVRDTYTRVRPGAGPVEVPAGDTPVLLDLTALPDHPALPDALRATTAVVLSHPQADRIAVRALEGMPDDSGVNSQFFPQEIVVAPRPDWPGAGPARPLAVQIDERPPPPAAALAGALRVNGRAWLVGTDLYAESAEVRSVPVGGGGLAIRWGVRIDDEDAPWPDVVPADAETIDGLPNAPLSAVAGPVERSALEPYRAGRGSAMTDGEGVQRAALLVAHAALRRFHGEVEQVGDALDARLLELIDAPLLVADDDTLDRRAFAARLWRLLDAARDALTHVSDLAHPGYAVAPVLPDFDIDGQPMVVRSNAAALSPGDVITHIEGVPQAAWFDEALLRAGGGSLGFTRLRAASFFTRGEGPLALSIRRPDGTTDDLGIERGPPSAFPVQAAWRHRSGMLDAMGAPGVLYVDPTAYPAAATDQRISAMRRALPEAEALILDLRGMPLFNIYRLAEAIVGSEPLSSPQFVIGAWIGPDHRDWRTDQYTVGGEGDFAFAGPVVVLTSPMTVAGAETVAVMLSHLEQVVVIGRQSASSLADRTAIDLPGRFRMAFSGYSTRFPDGRPHFGVGVVPDIEVWPTAASRAAGVDDELEAALDWLGAR